MKTSCEIVRSVDSPENIFLKKCREEFKKRKMTDIARESEVPIDSIRKYKRDGQLGTEYRNMLACCIFKKETWWEVVQTLNASTNSEGIAEIMPGEELGKLRDRVAVLEYRIDQLEKYMHQPPRHGASGNQR